MVNYADLYNQNGSEIDLINDKRIPAATTDTVLSFTVPKFYIGYTTAFLIREFDANYTDFTFEIRINKINVFTKWNLNPGFIPLLPGFMEFMREIKKGDVIDIVVTNDGAERNILGWIKLVWSKGWKI